MDNIKYYTVKLFKSKAFTFILSSFPDSLTLIFTNIFSIALNFVSSLYSLFVISIKTGGDKLVISGMQSSENLTALLNFAYGIRTAFTEAMRITSFPMSEGSLLSFILALNSKETTEITQSVTMVFDPILAVFNYLSAFDPMTLGDLDVLTLGDMDYTIVV